MGGLSWWHWMIILAAFILLFGAKKLPDAARGLGRSLRILKSEITAMSDDENAATAAKNREPDAGRPAVPLPDNESQAIEPIRSTVARESQGA